MKKRSAPASEKYKLKALENSYEDPFGFNAFPDHPKNDDDLKRDALQRMSDHTSQDTINAELQGVLREKDLLSKQHSQGLTSAEQEELDRITELKDGGKSGKN